MVLPPTKVARDLPYINDRIRFPEVRVIDTDGSNLGVMHSKEAQRIAEDIAVPGSVKYRLIFESLIQ